MEGLPLSYTQYSNHEQDIIFTDLKTGNVNNTAFTKVSTTDNENYVYIVSLGNEIPTEAPVNLGSIKTTGNHRGFLKVRVLTDGNMYTIQYAEINETNSFNEIRVPKNESKVTTAVSLSTNKIVDIEPETNKWDINFYGVYSFSAPSGFGLTYSDYGLHNTLGNVGMYQVTIYEIDQNDNRIDFDVPSYTEFSINDVDESDLAYDDRTVISSSWRLTPTNTRAGIAKDNRYFILKDAEGKFIQITFYSAIK